MQRIANLDHLRTLYDNARDFLISYTPLSSPISLSRSQSLHPDLPKPPPPTNALPSPPGTPDVYPTPLPATITRAPSQLSERLHAACLSPTSSIASLPPDTMRRELDNAKHQLARSNADIAKLEERCRMLEKTLKDTRDILRAREAEIDKLRKERERDLRERERERGSKERRRSDVGPHQYVPKDKEVHSRHSSLDIRTSTSSPVPHRPATAPPPPTASSSNSEEDTARARASEIYLTRTDNWSGAQILQAIHDINSEILQFAASASELCSPSSSSPPHSSPPRRGRQTRSIQAMHDTTSRIGQAFTRILANRDHTHDPILVQLALQGCISLCVARAMGSFCIGFPGKSDSVLGAIYGHMQIAEPQPTSSKWRSLTHSSIHTLYPSLTEYSTTELSDTILRWAADIFLVAGCNGREYRDGRDVELTSRDGLRARFGEQVRRIARGVCRLARVVKEDMLSANFEVVVIDPASPPPPSSGTSTHAYDPAKMHDLFGEYVPSRGCVLATTELGLRCVKRVGGEQLREGESAVMEQRVLLLPKVVLESVVDVLEER